MLLVFYNPLDTLTNHGSDSSMKAFLEDDCWFYRVDQTLDPYLVKENHCSGLWSPPQEPFRTLRVIDAPITDPY
ncbi:hypothetical protein CC2G_009236 [Coprinopsis cinerea AmutBmut pab1-1]|nr:hypothetical protein CC2G_009236 [Coprinopsis cinerea AmutBmut pab1-1]